MKRRKAMLAGSWYPADAGSCEKEISEFLERNDFPAYSFTKRLGAIVPHAGWFFSGDIACNTINSLQGETDVIAIFGMHLGESHPPFIVTEGAWETPLGDIPIARDLALKLAQKKNFK